MIKKLTIKKDTEFNVKHTHTRSAHYENGVNDEKWKLQSKYKIVFT